jgi:hypothetical protein
MPENKDLISMPSNIPAPVMPLVPDLLANAMPTPVPQMQWGSGIVNDFFHNWKLKRLDRATEREANISANKHRDVKAKLDTIHEIVTFSKRLEVSIRQYNHQLFMMDKAEQREEALLIEQQLKNMLLQGEVKLNEVELKIKLKEMEDLLGTPQA